MADSMTYAKFWRCALQVNPSTYSGKYRSQDHGLDLQGYLEALVKKCQSNNIKVIGLADHGSVAEVDVIRSHLTEFGVIVFPGFEIASTEKVHWVCLFPENTPTTNLERYLGKLDLTDPEDGVRPSGLGSGDILEKVSELGGFCYAAHATDDNGLIYRKLPHIWKNPLLAAAQIPGKLEDLEFADQQILKNKDPNYNREKPAAIINAKDVEQPDTLDNPKSWCYVKMTKPCFESFVIAFKDRESRIKLAHEVQEAHCSQFKRLSVSGGYLDGITLELSEHLNSLIGGRGTGKSTLLECLRYVLEITPKGKSARKQHDDIVKENLKGATTTLELTSASHHCKPFTIIRTHNEPARVIDEHGNTSAMKPADLLPTIDIYGQNEIYELARSDGELIRVLDRFLPDASTYSTSISEIQRRLDANSNDLEKALRARDTVEEQTNQLPKLKEQLKAYEELGIKDDLKTIEQLAQVGKLRTLMDSGLKEQKEAFSNLGLREISLSDISDDKLVGLPLADELKKGRKVIEDYNFHISGLLAGLKQHLSDAQTQFTAWTTQFQTQLLSEEQKAEAGFKKLPEISGKPGREVGQAYKELVSKIARIEPQQASYDKNQEQVEELEQIRRNILNELSTKRSERTAAQQKSIKKLNKKLKGQLQLELIPNGNRQALVNYLMQLPGVGASKVAWVEQSESFSIPALVEAIKEGKDTIISRGWGVTQGVAETLSKLSIDQIMEIEAIDLEDRVIISLNVSHEGENYRTLDKLSIGQQCTAILMLLLLDNKDPLVMDQPEDNLDNAFIADKIVRNLRTAKVKRQFVFATHNANIPVFGDAEWIGVFSANEQQAELPDGSQGSIDIPFIKKNVADILEGGRDAFVQRKEKYDF